MEKEKKVLSNETKEELRAFDSSLQSMLESLSDWNDFHDDEINQLVQRYSLPSLSKTIREVQFMIFNMMRDYE